MAEENRAVEERTQSERRRLHRHRRTLTADATTSSGSSGDFRNQLPPTQELTTQALARAVQSNNIVQLSGLARRASRTRASPQASPKRTAVASPLMSGHAFAATAIGGVDMPRRRSSVLTTRSRRHSRVSTVASRLARLNRAEQLTETNRAVNQHTVHGDLLSDPDSDASTGGSVEIRSDDEEQSIVQPDGDEYSIQVDVLKSDSGFALPPAAGMSKDDILMQPIVNSSNDKLAPPDQKQGPHSEMSSNHSSRPFDWDGAGDNAEAEEEARKSWLQRHLPHWLLVLLQALFGSAMIMTPAILVYWLVPFETYSLIQYRARTNSYMEMMRWSILLASLFACHTVARHSLSALPLMLLRIAQLLSISVSERTKMRLEYVQALTGYLAYVVFSGIAVALVNVFFIPPSVDVPPFTYQTYMGRIAFFLLIASSILVAEKLLVHVIALRFHRVAYADRVSENDHAARMLDRFHLAARHAALMNASQLNQAGDNNRHSRLANIQVFGKTTLQALQNLTADVVVGSSEVELNSTREAKRLARYIFENLCPRNQNHMRLTDIVIYFPSFEAASEAFHLFDRDESGEIGRQEMRQSLMSIYKERKRLAKSMHDLGHCVGKLDSILMSITTFFTIIIAFPIFGVEMYAFLASIGTLLLGLSFVFGTTARTIFESLIFLFVTHPFDVGDRVILGTENFIVHEIGILSTVFIRTDGQMVYMPNAILSTMSIYNVRRSPYMTEVIPLHIDVRTPSSQLALLRERINEFVQSESRDYASKVDLFGFDITDSCRMTVNLGLQHRGNFQDGSLRWSRRNKFMLALKDIIMDLGIRYYPPTQRMEVRKVENF